MGSFCEAREQRIRTYILKNSLQNVKRSKKGMNRRGKMGLKDVSVLSTRPFRLSLEILQVKCYCDIQEGCFKTPES